MKKFEVQQFGGKLQIFSDDWYSTTRNPDTVRREINKWLEQCTELEA